jgi:Ca2+-binding RTX toxin-like protein
VSVAAASFETAQGGQVTLHADGTFTYDPAAGFVGSDSFTYTAVDPAGNGSDATVTLTVTNAAPTVRTDSFTAKFGLGTSGNVLLNDTDADGDAISAVAGTFATARGGSVVLKADGTFIYTPPEAFYGQDSFQYAARDGLGSTSTAVAFVTTAAPVGSLYGTAADDIRDGTALADYMFDFDGDDILRGLDGNDVLAGGGDKDTLSGDGGNDKLYGQAGKDLLKGGVGADYLSGGIDGDDLYGEGGADKLNGGAGLDKYFGGGGNDQFIFDAANGTSYDRVMDFRLGDKLTVKASDYGLGPGALADASYFANAGAASVSHGRFLYTAASRSLAWDADGNGATANVVIAVFDRAVTLSATDFLVI